MLRTGRKGLAAATLLGDMLKGTAAVLLDARGSAAATPALAAGFGAVLGHVFPVWLNFKGGKGVATYIGVLIAVSWPVALSFAMIWAVGAALSRYSSLAGLIASAATPVLLWIFVSGNAGLGVRYPDRPRLGHAPRQHFAADGRHRSRKSARSAAAGSRLSAAVSRGGSSAASARIRGSQRSVSSDCRRAKDRTPRRTRAVSPPPRVHGRKCARITVRRASIATARSAVQRHVQHSYRIRASTRALRILESVSTFRIV